MLYEEYTLIFYKIFKHMIKRWLTSHYKYWNLYFHTKRKTRKYLSEMLRQKEKELTFFFSFCLFCLSPADILNSKLCFLSGNGGDHFVWETWLFDICSFTRFRKTRTFSDKLIWLGPLSQSKCFFSTRNTLNVVKTKSKLQSMTSHCSE